MKKCIVILLCFTTLLLNSCTFHEGVNFVGEKEERALLYNDVKYYESDLFTVTERSGKPDENDIQLGWYYSFPFSTDAYSDTLEDPVFIYTDGSDENVYFRHDYDYLTDTFIIENTDVEIVWEDVFGPQQNNAFLLSSSIDVTLYSKQYPRINARLGIGCVDNQWFIVSLPNLAGVWTPSDEFLQILFDNGIISS